MTTKELTDSVLLGEQEASLISHATARLGFVWRPTPQHDRGIGDKIEIRNPATGAVSGLIIKAKSKPLTILPNHTMGAYDYWPNQSGVSNWLGHNFPVILVVSQPAINEVFWQTVEQPISPTSLKKKFHFSKANDELDASSRDRCIEEATGSAREANGFMLVKPVRQISNFVPVTKLERRTKLMEQ